MFVFAFVCTQTARILDASLLEEVQDQIQESDFANKTIIIIIIPVGKIRSSIPNGCPVSWYVRDKSECFDMVSIEEQENKKEATAIHNLDDYVGHLGRLGWFILINNFQGINIPELKHPVILRYLRIVALPTIQSIQAG